MMSRYNNDNHNDKNGSDTNDNNDKSNNGPSTSLVRRVRVLWRLYHSYIPTRLTFLTPVLYFIFVYFCCLCLGEARQNFRHHQLNHDRSYFKSLCILYLLYLLTLRTYYTVLIHLWNSYSNILYRKAGEEGGLYTTLNLAKSCFNLFMLTRRTYLLIIPLTIITY